MLIWRECVCFRSYRQEQAFPPTAERVSWKVWSSDVRRLSLIWMQFVCLCVCVFSVSCWMLSFISSSSIGHSSKCRFVSLAAKSQTPFLRSQTILEHLGQSGACFQPQPHSLRSGYKVRSVWSSSALHCFLITGASLMVRDVSAQTCVGKVWRF